MWNLTIAVFQQTDENSYVLFKKEQPLQFATRQEAEEYMTEYVYSKTENKFKFLGFLDSPHGMHETLDPTLRFWLDYHLAI